MTDLTDRSVNRRSPGLDIYVDLVHWFKGKYPLGYSHDLVYEGDEPYLERRILWLLGFTLRYHVFHKGDRDRHLHDHPWWFITFPLDDYYELVDPEFVKKLRFPKGVSLVPGSAKMQQRVRRHRFHFRPAEYRHAVLDTGNKVRTLVLSGRKTRAWGFWVNGEFVYYRDYNA